MNKIQDIHDLICSDINLKNNKNFVLQSVKQHGKF